MLIYPRLGINKHKPNDDLFSRSSLIFFEISVVNTIRAVDNKMVTIAVEDQPRGLVIRVSDY